MYSVLGFFYYFLKVGIRIRPTLLHTSKILIICYSCCTEKKYLQLNYLNYSFIKNQLMQRNCVSVIDDNLKVMR